MLAQRIADNEKHIERTEELYAKVRALKHDMNNHIMALEAMIAQGRTDEARGYASDIKERLVDMDMPFHTGNSVTDIIIAEYAERFADKDISFESDLEYPKNADISPFDMSVILGNALQNALEAEAEKVRRVVLGSIQKGHTYILDVRNSIAKMPDIESESGLCLSAKGEGHGYGLHNILDTAKKYRGDTDIRFETDEDGTMWFILNVMLQTDGQTDRLQR